MRNSVKMRRQRGQTLILVAVSLVALVAVAALAIDLTTLYVARTETQRAADAAALAGAEAFVDSGTTTAPTDANLQSLATTMANGFINSLLAQNTVGGATPAMVGAPVIDFAGHPGNPQITVTLQRTDVPTFFARIFGQRLATVTATATAEAYNPSGIAGAPPVAPTCVKPWAIANADTNHPGNTFVDPATGTVTNPGAWNGGGGGVVGEQLNLISGCAVGGALCSLLSSNPPVAGSFLPLQLASAVTGTCPSCAVGGSRFEQSISCCDTANAYTCGGTAPNALVSLLSNPLSVINDSISGASCLLTGGSGTGPIAGQDQLDPAPFWANPATSPMQITAGSGPHAAQVVTTSNSIVTLPIMDTSNPIPLLGALAGQVKVVGYMQGFVQNASAAGIQVTVINIVGCGGVNTALPPVSGGGVSPVPVRLIHN